MDIKTQISRLCEDELRDKVIIPMLNAIGAYGVEKFHGVREKGKDVYFSYEDIFGEDKHCCFFIKKGNITKSGTNDIRKMEGQIQEALICEFTSPINNIDLVHIEEFYFVTNGKVNKEARNYLSEMVIKRHMPNIRIYDIDRLVKILIRKVIKPFNDNTNHDYIFQKDNFNDICREISKHNFQSQQKSIIQVINIAEDKPIK